jgi:hypothetical protein
MKQRLIDFFVQGLTWSFRARRCWEVQAPEYPSPDRPSPDEPDPIVDSHVLVAETKPKIYQNYLVNNSYISFKLSLMSQDLNIVH